MDKTTTVSIEDGKTYFLAWSCGTREGHSLYEFPLESSSRYVPPREVLKAMLKLVKGALTAEGRELGQEVVATQFNRVT